MVGEGEILSDGTQLPDEPQHKKQGDITLKQLDILDIPYEVIDRNTSNIEEILYQAHNQAISRSGPCDHCKERYFFFIRI